MSARDTKPEFYKVLVLITWDSYCSAIDLRTKSIKEAFQLITAVANDIAIQSFSISIGDLLYTWEESQDHPSPMAAIHRAKDISNWDLET